MKLAGVQYLRAVAAIGVVLDHCAVMISFPKYFGRQVFLFDFWQAGSLGVQLFFMISGFIIVVSSLEPYSLSPDKTPASFFVARFLRVVPMMWIAILSYAALRYVGRGDVSEISSYVNAFFLLPFGDYDPNNIWTLRHELMFYLVFAATFLPARPLRVLLFVWFFAPPVLWGLGLMPAAAGPLGESFGNFFSRWNILFGVGAVTGLLYQKFADRREHVLGAIPPVLSS